MQAFEYVRAYRAFGNYFMAIQGVIQKLDDCYFEFDEFIREAEKYSENTRTNKREVKHVK